MAEINVEALAMLAVHNAAIDWWKGRRPCDWTEAQHISNPCVNTSETANEKRLAEAVAKMIELENDHD